MSNRQVAALPKAQKVLLLSLSQGYLPNKDIIAITAFVPQIGVTSNLFELPYLRKLGKVSSKFGSVYSNPFWCLRARRNNTVYKIMVNVIKVKKQQKRLKKFAAFDLKGVSRIRC